MTELLGSKYCLNSLSKDIDNLQDTVNVILEKTGKLEYSSWKFPNENSSVLDIKDLLDDYEYCNDVDANKFSHIMLFELVIDRFCLILQAVTKLLDQSLLTDSTTQDERPKSRTVTSTMSVGLVSKMFWNKVSQIQYIHNKLEKEVSDSNHSLMKLENDYLQVKMENESLKAKSKNKHFKENFITQEITENNILKKENPSNLLNHSTQTYETAFLPCEYCNDMQLNLLNVGGELIKICESQGLPSALSKQKRLMKDITMTTKDINKWSSEEGKDIQRINDFLTSLTNQIAPLKKYISNYETETEHLNNQLNTFEKSNSNLKSQIEELENMNIKYKKDLESIKSVLSANNETISNLQIEENNLKDTLTRTKEELEKQKISSNALEQGIQSLSSQIKLAEEEKEQYKNYKQQLENNKETKDTLEKQFNVLQGEIKKYKLELEKSKAENKVLLQHDESLQKKQGNLLSRLEQMEEDLEEQNEEINMLKEENESLTNSVKNYKDKAILENQLTQQPVEENLLHKLKLVINYPVFSQHYKQAGLDYQTILDDPNYHLDEDNENVLLDMENQFKANEIRITVLKDENGMLENNLLKLRDSLHSSQNEKVNMSNEKISIERSDLNHLKKPRNNSAPVQSDNNHHIPRPPSEPRSANMSTNRPHSASSKNDTFDISSRLANLERMKNNYDKPADVRPAWSDSSSSKVYTMESDNKELNKKKESNTTVTCPDCDKTYLSNNDLEIHRNFCYGRL